MAFDPSNIEDHFSFYLKRIGIDENDLSDPEYKSLKNSFYGGCTSMIICALSSNEEDDKMNVEKVLAQLENHWKVENIKDFLNID